MVAIVTVDGPSGTGKGTLSRQLARWLGWAYLDSGALYRALGLAVARAGIAFDDESAIAALALQLPLRFEPQHDDDVRVLLAGDDVSRELRTEQGAARASKVALWPQVRDALLAWQRSFAVEPGLVADGRDMGTVVFPDARLKIFLEASAEERAARRYKQLRNKGLSVSLPGLLAQIQERDARDRTRAVAPLVAANDAIVIDSTQMSIEEVYEAVLVRAQTALA